MLPFYERVVSVPRKDVAPVWTRSYPIAKEPTTLGEHLRKKRFSAGFRQLEAAQILGVSNRTLSLWETDRVYPAWASQPRLITYLGYDPFNDPTLGRPKGNEPSCVAFLSQSGPLSLGHQIMKRRLEMRKNRKQCAEEMGISAKTLHAWETNRYQPSSALLKRLVKCLGLDLETSSRQILAEGPRS
jgi:transcriptional regulator with XRE-family HTH domain